MSYRPPMSIPVSRRQFALSSLALGTSILGSSVPLRPAAAAAARFTGVVPGNGIRVARTGDDFEATDWVYHPNAPKSSYNIDENMRTPGGMSSNQRWTEAGKRGTPDSVRRVTTPPGGLEGSTGAMLIRTLQSGIPGRPTGQQQQDDLLHNVQGQVGRTIPVSWTPNCICRVYTAPATLWENRNGPSFGYRIGLLGQGRKSSSEEYWPGMFIHMERGVKEGKQTYGFRLWVRGDGNGRDLPGPIFQPEEWITLGMTCSPDGQVHFFARKGVEPLEPTDCLGSFWPYSYRAHSFQTFFYNIINQDDGRSVSTPWVVDDAMLYAATAPTTKIRNANAGKFLPKPPADSPPANSEAPATPALITNGLPPLSGQQATQPSLTEPR